MYNFIKFGFIICIFCNTNILRPVHGGDCSSHTSANPEVKQWSFGNESTQPAHNIIARTIISRVNNEPELEVLGNETREPFILMLFAIPYLKNLSECPNNVSESRSLRQHDCIMEVRPSVKYTSFRRVYDKIFTGCYYLVMKNEKNEKWMVGPNFFNISYNRYLKPKLEIVEETKDKPESLQTTRELITAVKVPHDCADVRARVYEFPGRINDTIDVAIRKDVFDETLSATQDCTIYHTVERKPECLVSNLTTNLGAEVSTNGMNDTSWKAIIRWTKLLRGGHTYYLRFQPTIRNECSDNMSLMSYYLRWDLIDPEIFLLLPYQDVDNSPPPKPPKPFNWILVLIAVFGIIAIAIFAYGIFKLLLFISIRRVINELQEPWRTIELPEEESEHILLIYVKGCPSFMKTIETLRDQLKQNFHNHVHDLYTTDEWEMVGGLGATGWVEKLLRDGSKVVWVDTPQFRSQINDNQNQHISGGDFRDAAIPYAVSLATTLFVNATTQYRRHFVVRVKEFVVQDGQDDPLLVVSPHVRYYIPEQIPLLCEHLKAPPKLLDSTEVEV